VEAQSAWLQIGRVLVRVGLAESSSVRALGVLVTAPQADLSHGCLTRDI